MYCNYEKGKEREKKGGGYLGFFNVPEYLRRGMSNVNYGFPKNGEGVFNRRIRCYLSDTLDYPNNIRKEGVTLQW